MVRGSRSYERPCLVASVDSFNHGPAKLVVVLPVTSTDTGIPFHVRIDTPVGGAKNTTFTKTEQPRCITTERLDKMWRRVSARTMDEVSHRLRILLDL